MMPAQFARGCTIVLTAAAVVFAFGGTVPAVGNGPNMVTFANGSGNSQTFTTNGSVDFDNPFFQSLGTNGRSCASCHDAGDGWTVVPSHVQTRFENSDGEDPIFRTNDGSNSPQADVSTVEARRQAYNMLLTKGLIRVGIGIPTNAEFSLIAVDDPYEYASSAELSLFRRPLPTTNLDFLATVMWDGRETFANQSIHFDLSDQANGATLGHAAAINALTVKQRNSIVQFETALYSSQAVDNAAGLLNGQRAAGGAIPLSKQPFFIGINDSLSAGFDMRVFTIFDSWKDLNKMPGSDPYGDARAAIYRGQEIFNTRQFTVSGVRGVNDRLNTRELAATCTVCHDSPNVGHHSVSLPLDLGLTDAARRTPDMPLYTLQNNSTGEIVQTTDPGRALITGKWNDMSTFKGPILRNLAARPPYFHNGSASTLGDVVDFYDTRFHIGLTRQDKADLVAFLSAL
jgi:cytochrome c peroxidase